jgi:hypothetical protein
MTRDEVVLDVSFCIDNSFKNMDGCAQCFNGPVGRLLEYINIIFFLNCKESCMDG